ncbi:hypothetical protein [Streptomyces scabiei]|uniref:hypothetical protein n=1 Tax=Streptomyces scabiei TaxID=1930 RepID=UPI0029AE443F|nr:hypothetical protein [Streptomyces scabiei]MDX3521327.1 hypothetical protein [Streptomyces scabiei]
MSRDEQDERVQAAGRAHLSGTSGELRLRLPSMTRTLAMVGPGCLALGITSGHAPDDPARLWALVALAIASLAHDAVVNRHRRRGR